jgi:hypothetical protein
VWTISLAGVSMLTAGLFLDWLALLRFSGFPARELSNSWVQADVDVVRRTAVLLGALVVGSQAVLWRYPRAVAHAATGAEALATTASRQPLLVPLALSALILSTVVFQLALYMFGYTAFSADDFGRPLSAAFWLRYRRFDLGMDGWLGLAGSGWLPFSDYVMAAGLAVHEDLFVTPRIVNLVLSSIAVITVYMLGREMFGRGAGLATAFLFTFQPWHVWLGMSGMSSDLPSVVLIPLFGMFLIRWLRHDDSRALLAAAASLALSNGFRYENWLFAVVLSAVIVFVGAARWRTGGFARSWFLPALAALVIADGFPLFWMAASYVVYGDWLPAMHGINAFMVAFLASQTSRVETQMGIPLMAVGSFPFEILLSAIGLAVVPGSIRLRPYRLYIVVIVCTALLFTVVFGGQLAAWLHIARYLLGFAVLALPFAGLLIVRMLTARGTWRAEGFVAGVIVMSTVLAFDVMRASNYPSSFDRDAIETGWMLRKLQSTGTVPADARILIERAPDFGDLSVVALANRPERFVVLNELAYRQMALSGLLANRPAALPTAIDRGVKGTVCEQDLALPACRDSIVEAEPVLVILSTPARVESFARAFDAPSWRMGRYHVFDMRRPGSSPSRSPAP